MNSLVTYISIGSILFGLFLGVYKNECGNFPKVETQNAVSMVLIWPSFLVVRLVADVEEDESYCNME